jgi:hypothetical protein
MRGFEIGLDTPAEGRPAYGPFEPDAAGLPHARRRRGRARDRRPRRARPDVSRHFAADRTEAHLREATATVRVTARVSEGRLVADVDVRNLAGHKFPRAYPSRHAWLHVTVTDAEGRVAFESGAFSADGRILGDGADENASRYEPHYDEITRADQVQIYEAVTADGVGRVTTGLMEAEGWSMAARSAIPVAEASVITP